MNTDPDYVPKVLAWCNDLARKQGKPTCERLPNGFRFDGESCPCGQVTGFHVGYATCDRVDSLGNVTESIPTPDFVHQFADDFDAGLLPQYDASLALPL
jgi:hypothetical protein